MKVKKAVKAVPKNRKQIRKEQRQAKKARKNDYYQKRGKILPVPIREKEGEPSNGKVTKPKKNPPQQAIAKDEQVKKEKKVHQNLQKEMGRQRRKLLIDANKKEDLNIKRLEKQLKLNKRKSKAVPKSFVEDGLDFLLEACDPEAMKGIAASEQQFTSENGEFEEDFALMTGNYNEQKGEKNSSDDSQYDGSDFDEEESDFDSTNPDVPQSDEGDEDGSNEDGSIGEGSIGEGSIGEGSVGEGLEEDGSDEEDDLEDDTDYYYINNDEDYIDDYDENKEENGDGNDSGDIDINGVDRPAELSVRIGKGGVDPASGPSGLADRSGGAAGRSGLTERSGLAERSGLTERSSGKKSRRSNVPNEDESTDDEDEDQEENDQNHFDGDDNDDDDSDFGGGNGRPGGSRQFNAYGNYDYPDFNRRNDDITDDCDNNNVDNNNEEDNLNYQNDDCEKMGGKLSKGNKTKNSSLTKNTIKRKSADKEIEPTNTKRMKHEEDVKVLGVESSGNKKASKRKLKTEDSKNAEDKKAEDNLRSKDNKKAKDNKKVKDNEKAEDNKKPNDNKKAKDNKKANVSKKAETTRMGEDEDLDEFDESLGESSDEETDEEKSNDGEWEDIYGRKRTKAGDVIQEDAGKYIPPAVRAKMESEFSDDKKRTEKLNRLKRTLKGLFNRLAESNMHSIASQIEVLYMNNSRNDMNDTITNLVLESAVSPAKTPERLLLEHVMLITVLHANVGTEVGAHFLQTLVKRFDTLFKGTEQVENKTMDNVVNVICQLYNFKVFHSQLLYQILGKLSSKFDEKCVECILLVLKNVGFTLRKDDPSALKNLILDLQKKAGSATDEVKDNARVKYMLDILLAIKNNNMNKIPNYDTSYSEHLKKLMKGFIRKGNYVTQLNISLDDLIKAEERGKWWVVGSAWTGVIENNQGSENVKKSEKFSQKLLKMAKSQRMNTDTRRNIFCILMSSEDYLDAFEKLLHLGLKNQEEREIINVVLHCCLREKKYNPYYSLIAQKFCEYDRKYQMTIKCSVWDKLKAITSGSQLSNLAKMLTHLFLEKGLPISTLKVLQFSELDKVTLRFMRQVMLGILLCENTEQCQEVFEKVALSEKLKMFKESLRLFVHHFLLKNLKSDAIPQEKRSLLEDRAKIVDKILSVNERKIRF